MSDAIHDKKSGGGENLVSNGYYAVDQYENLILVPPLQQLKASMRLATAADIAKASAKSNPSPPKPAAAPSAAKPMSAPAEKSEK